MSNVYIASDLHIGHKNICKYRPEFATPEEHNQILIDNVLTACGKRDTLWLLGDICFDESFDWIYYEFCKHIGNVNLILGNHCHTEDTELLTKEGWRSVKDITKKDFVGSVDLDTGLLGYYTPSRLVVNDESRLYSVKGSWVDEKVSEGHNVVLNGSRVPVKDCIGVHNNRSFTLAASDENQKGISLSDDLLALITWVVMDGTLVRASEKKTRLQFKLSKPRKIEKLEGLLSKMGIPYTKRACKKYGINKMQPYYIRIYGQHSLEIHRLLSDQKRIPQEWMNLSTKQLDVVLASLVDTDASKDHHKIQWTSTDKHNVDTLQLACIKNNRPFVYSVFENLSGFDNAKTQYRCFIADSPQTRSKCAVEIKDTGEVGKTYGVTVPHGTVVSRRNGRVSVTGNCSENNERQRILGYAHECGAKLHSLVSYKGCWLSHHPIHPQELRGKFNIHGHMHREHIDDTRYYNACVEHTNWKPKLFKEILAELQGRN